MSAGGPTAKNAFRYQDWCAMYFALEGFIKDGSFEHIFCEQGKMDFEIWSTASFAGFQVKTKATGLTAEETNRIFLHYLRKSVTSGKENKAFRFVFGEQPTKSLGHLFARIRRDDRGIKYGRKVQHFIDRALSGVNTLAFSIGFHHLSEDQIRHLVFSISAELLKARLETGSDIPTEVVRTFVARLRDEIDRISCKRHDNDRIYSTLEIDSLITDFLSGVRIQQLENKGRRSIEVKLPAGISHQRLEVIIRAPIVEGLDAKDGDPIKDNL